VPWHLKPACSVTAGSQTLPDGRGRYWVRAQRAPGRDTPDVGLVVQPPRVLVGAL